MKYLHSCYVYFLHSESLQCYHCIISSYFNSNFNFKLTGTMRPAANVLDNNYLKVSKINAPRKRKG